MAVTDILADMSIRLVRYRCVTCEVAWTSAASDDCWICDKPGFSLRSAFSLREDDYLHLDFQ